VWGNSNFLFIFLSGLFIFFYFSAEKIKSFLWSASNTNIRLARHSPAFPLLLFYETATGSPWSSETALRENKHFWCRIPPTSTGGRP